MVDYARTVAPLQHKLEDVMVTRGRRKSRLAGVDLTWTKDDESAFRVVLKLHSNSSKMFFPDRDAHVCLFSDASASGWAVVLTQVRRHILRLRSSTMKCWYAAVEHLPSRKSTGLLSRKKDTLSLELVMTLSVCSTERKLFKFTVTILISFRILRRYEK
ncbi:unnamed protein product [Phytophthora fragariaefolia]|uniref:Unnamed protein product n=1 Tax=Phytophthora fragariaefolia TaxID=1490495 RepID=A0A9W6YGE2_9STRA|nr:unnamed protein product [Phytophthora fragariaefolia]